MPRGGKREGSGRKPGSGHGKRSAEVARQIMAEAGITPLAYMQGVLDGTMEYDEKRAWAAEKAAPYIHARLAAVEHSGPGGGPLQVQEVEWTIVDPQAQTSDRPRLRAIAGGK